jgi:class 3 adenylate cyclase
MGFHHIRNAPLALVLSVPAKTVFEPLDRLSLQILTLNLLMIMGLFILLSVVSRKISKPIIDLKDSAIHVTSSGSYSDPIQVITADEVGQLTSAFNEMMEGLRQRDFIRDTFGRYVTKEVVEELLDTSEGLKLGGEVREVTIMFSDLRGFTPLCEQLPPDTLITLLNSYLSRMSTIIGEYKGTINEFIGDAILTFFGAPVKHGDSPERAVACALAMQMSMEEVNRENRNKGLPPLSMGIGVNTGEVIVGNIGSEERAKYGVVGHHINLASRVEGMTLGGQILITPSTYEQVKEVVIIRAVHPVKFKGVEEKIDLYDIVGMHSPYNLLLSDQNTETMPLIKPIPVTVYRMKGKKTGSAEMKAQLTQFSPPRAILKGPDKIEPLNEVRVDFTEQDEGERIYLYAKVASFSQTGGYFMHILQISYSTPVVYKFIRRYMK